VLPHGARRDLLVRTLDEVNFPGLEGAGVETAAGCGWVTERRLAGGSAGVR
jgi:hypothetical protein